MALSNHGHEGSHAEAGVYAGLPGKVGAYAGAGVGGTHAELSLEGPNASAGAEIGVTGVGAMARAEVGSASVQAGPVGVKLGLGVDTGASVGADGVEVKVLGTGFTIGQKNSLSVLGSEVSCSIM